MKKNHKAVNPYEPPKLDESEQMGDGATVRCICPVCGQATDSLKQYTCYGRCGFYVIWIEVQTVVYRACPVCLRQFLWRTCLDNMISANVFWLLLLLPKTLLQVASTHTTGHSRSVLRSIDPEDQLRRRFRFSLKRVAVGIGVMFICLALAVVALWIFTSVRVGQ
jgi:hypothetical protein